jgi:flavodoxin
MKKILIAYFSLKGHTEQLADYIAEGVRMAGAEADVKKISQIKKPEDLAGYDGYIFGSPTYHRDAPQKVKSFLFLAKDANLEGKLGGAFGSYTHSGDAPKLLFETMEFVYNMKPFKLGSFNVKEADIGKPEYLKACHDYGKAFVEEL